jgi:hypothetical protein
VQIGNPPRRAHRRSKPNNLAVRQWRPGVRLRACQPNHGPRQGGVVSCLNATCSMLKKRTPAARKGWATFVKESPPSVSRDVRLRFELWTKLGTAPTSDSPGAIARLPARAARAGSWLRCDGGARNGVEAASPSDKALHAAHPPPSRRPQRRAHQRSLTSRVLSRRVFSPLRYLGHAFREDATRPGASGLDDRGDQNLHLVV